MIYNHLINKAFLLFFALILSTSLTAEVSPDAGKTLFKNYCATCHAKDMKTPATGPALGHTSDYWKNDTLNFLAYLNDSQTYMSSHRNARIDSLNKEYRVISHKNNLTLEELRSLITYMNL